MTPLPESGRQMFVNVDVLVVNCSVPFESTFTELYGCP